MLYDRAMRPLPIELPRTTRAVLAAGLVTGLVACGGGECEPSERVRAVFAAAQQEARTGDRQRALDLYGEVVREEPCWKEAWLARARLAGMMGDYATAIESERHLLGEDPDDASAAERLTLAAMQLGDFETASEGVGILSALEPDSVRTLYLGAQLAFEDGDVPRAGELARRAAAKDGSLAAAHHIAAYADEDAAETERAMQGYRRALQADPGHLGARDRLALLLAQTGEADEAAEHRRIHELMTNATPGGFRKQTAAKRVETFLPLVSELAFWPLAWVELGRAYLDGGAPGEAERALRAGLRAHPLHPQMVELLERAQREQGKQPSIPVPPGGRKGKGKGRRPGGGGGL